jgi:hypothetical protein
VKRFIITENIARFRGQLERESDESVRRTLQTLLCQAQRELALLDSSESGAGARALGDTAQQEQLAQDFLDAVRHSPIGTLLLDPNPGLKIVGLNDAYARATMAAPDAVVGQGLFDAFPDNPALPDADGVRRLYESLRLVAQTLRPHAMGVQRYDVRDSGGAYVERYWRFVNSPGLAADGTLAYLVHQVEAAARPSQTAADAANLQSAGGDFNVLKISALAQNASDPSVPPPRNQ